jgi:hypothetical protein
MGAETLNRIGDLKEALVYCNNALIIARELGNEFRTSYHYLNHEIKRKDKNFSSASTA